ncbi:MAG: CotH kinase family protein, partial [Bacteroidetes bacterium]|nr:CotH kinase family protein [Bacteroidota bacterium]
EGWRIHRNRVPFWWKVLLADTAFVHRLERRWFSLRTGLLSTARLGYWIDSVSTSIAPALARDHALWRLHDTYVWMDAWESRSVAEELHFLKTWLRDRIDWMDTHIAGIADWRPDPERSPLHTIDGVAPQPARGAFTLAFTLGMYGHVTVTISDLLGRERLRREAGVVGIGAHTVQLDARGLPAGCYLLRLHVGPRIVETRTILISQ